MKKKAWMTAGIILGLVLLAGLLFYISPRMTPKKAWKLVYIPKAKDGTNDFWTSLISGTRMAADEYSADLTAVQCYEHDFHETARSEATCAAEGEVTYVCTVCGETYTEALPRTAHIDADDNNRCDNCNEMIVGYDLLSADGTTRYVLDPNGTLTISGTGPASFFSEQTGDPNFAVFAHNITAVKKIVVAEGVTDVSNLFGSLSHYFVNLTGIDLASTVTTALLVYGRHVGEWIDGILKVSQQ